MRAITNELKSPALLREAESFLARVVIYAGLLNEC